MSTLPNNVLYLPRNGEFHFSDWVTYKQSPSIYVNRFFHGRDNLNTKAIQFGTRIMDLLEFDPTHRLVRDLPVHPFIEYDLECLLGGVVPICTHPDSVDIEWSLGVYEYKTALTSRSWNSRMVYKQQQISFYQMCIREKTGGEWNPDDNFIVEIPTERKQQTVIDGVSWDNTEEAKYLEIGRKVNKDSPSGFEPARLHRRVVTEKELDVLRDDVIETALEVSGLYKKYLEQQLAAI